MDNNSKLTDLEEKFCMVYACGPAPYNGNAKLTYDLVFNRTSGRLSEDDSEDDALVVADVEKSMTARKLAHRPDIKARIEEIISDNMVNATTLRPRLTETLLKIAEECSTETFTDKFGTPLSPAALRSVAVNAIGKLTDMYGIKEDIAHKVMLEGADGDGITFNLIMPEKKQENSVENILGGE